MIDKDEIKRIPLDAVSKMKQLNPGHHLSDVIQGLIENSIDSHCSQITIYLENDGLSLIKVIDDGCGIPKSSLPNVCRFHYTSKINEITQTKILHGKSFGFTGSFLANLSCVSTIKISTKFQKESQSNFGIYEFNLMTKTGASYENETYETGTCIEVMNYLYNFPNQRLKIRKNAKEMNKLIDTIAKYSAVYSWIAFKAFLNDQLLLNTFGNKDLLTNIASIHQLAEPLKLFHVACFEKLENDIDVIILLSNPRYSYVSKNNMFLRAVFFNGRLISAPFLKKPINKFYQDFKRKMNSYYSKMPYFIFIKAPETFMNDVFAENENDNIFVDTNDDETENKDLSKEEKFFFQKFTSFNTEKLIQEVYQIITYNKTPTVNIYTINEIRRIEGKLINDFLCNPPSTSDTSKFLYPLPQSSANSPQPPSNSPQTAQTQPQPPKTHTIQVQPPISVTNVLASSQSTQQQQQQVSQAPPATTRVISQPQVQAKTVTSTIHKVSVAKSPIVKRAISPAPSATSTTTTAATSTTTTTTTAATTATTATTVTAPAAAISTTATTPTQKVAPKSEQPRELARSSSAGMKARAPVLSELLTDAPSVANSPAKTTVKVLRKVTPLPLAPQPAAREAAQAKDAERAGVASSSSAATVTRPPHAPAVVRKKIIMQPKSASSAASGAASGGSGGTEGGSSGGAAPGGNAQ